MGGAPTDRHLLRQLEASTGGRHLDLAKEPAVEDLLAEELALLDQEVEHWVAGAADQERPPTDPDADALLEQWPRW